MDPEILATVIYIIFTTSEKAKNETNDNVLILVSVYKFDKSPLAVIPACPESLCNKDSRRISFAGMTGMSTLWTGTI